METIVLQRRVVPNVQPIEPPGQLRIALIGEAPGEDEENHLYPFVGASGKFLTNLLNDVGINRHQCLVGNICQVRPPANKIELFPWDGPEIQTGLAKLHEDIRVYNPHITVLLGGTPLRAAKGPCKITNWRGSLFISTEVGPFYGRKCIPSLHPAFVLRDFSGYPLLKFDLTRARDEASTPGLILPQRELLTDLSAEQIIFMLDYWPKGQPCTVDIEGGLPEWEVNEGVKKDSKKRRHIGWRCIALAARPERAFAIPWWRFTLEEHCRVLRSLANLLGRTDVPKTLQNGLYDNFVLTYGYGILIRGVAEETMLKSHEIYAELPRALGVQASIWTREPHWKDESMYQAGGDALAVGCCKDVTVTTEICLKQDVVLRNNMPPTSYPHYRTMVKMLNPFLYMELRGIKYDKQNAANKLKDTIEGTEGLNEVAERLESTAKRSLRGPKGSLVPQRLTKLLYVDGVDGIVYPPQYKKENGRKTNKLTTDAEALLTLKKHRPDDKFLSDLLRHRHLEGVRETLQIETDRDGRVRCGYSLEAETGRVKCYTSPTGSGANLQTIQQHLRGNYLADEGFDFFQCDLEGADGYTVASYADTLGDPNMLLDYQAGMKPAKILGMYYIFGPEFGAMPRDEMREAIDFWFPHILRIEGKWLYLGCKRVQHGSSYLMGIPTMQLNVLRDSYKESGIPIYMTHQDAVQLQSGCMFRRYPGVQRWHDWAQAKLVADGKLTAASGHTRIFFGRRYGREIKDTVKAFLAHEPQNNTTWATNLAMLNLWNDPDNRRPDGSLIIEPLHQVHDALCGQWPQVVREWARAKVKTYFNNRLTISGHDITIPFDGAFGRSWGELTNKI